jgi:hypothetical protein
LTLVSGQGSTREADLVGGRDGDMLVRMDTTELISALHIVAENTEQLLYALDDLGFEGLDVRKIDGGYGLFCDEILLAAGCASDEIEAIEGLLDRAADLFFHRIPEG